MSKVPYSSTIYGLMYDMVCIRQNIEHAVGFVSMYMKNLGKENWKAIHWILRYLRGTTSHALCYGGADMEGDKENRRSTIGYVFNMGGTIVSWILKLQKVVSLSTTKAKYIASTKASKEMIWLHRFMGELGKKQENTMLYNDIQISIHLGKNSSFHSRTKHIQLKYHFIRSIMEDEPLKLENIDTSQNLA